MNQPHPHRPVHTIYRLFTACLIGAAALILSACATTDTEETPAVERQHFFSPGDGTWFGVSTPWTEETIREITTNAKNGDAAAQYELALIFLGDGKTNERAFDLMKKAAEQGNANAEVYLGTMYRNGQGVKKDRDEAIRWYNAAIARGSAWGMFEMGSLLYERPKRDTPKTLEWFKKAADAGYPMAQTAYGVFLLEGKDLPKDVVNGERYMKAAAESGDPFAQLSLSMMYARGMHFEKNLDIAEEWATKSAKQNYVPALQTLMHVTRMKEKEALKQEKAPARP